MNMSWKDHSRLANGIAADNSLQFWAQDPNGLEIEFQQYTERSSQFTGENVDVT